MAAGIDANDYDCRSLFSGTGERRFFFWRCRNPRVTIAPLRQTRSYAMLERSALYGISAHALSPSRLHLRSGSTSQGRANTNSRRCADRHPIKRISPRTLITSPSLPAGIPSTSLTNTTVSPTSIANDVISLFWSSSPALVHFKARVAVLILGDGGSPNHGDGFQVALPIGLRKDGKTQDPAFAWS